MPVLKRGFSFFMGFCLLEERKFEMGRNEFLREAEKETRMRYVFSESSKSKEYADKDIIPKKWVPLRSTEIYPYEKWYKHKVMIV